MIGVETLGVGFPTTCPMIFRGLSVPNIASCGGVATLGAGFPTRCSRASRSSHVRNMASFLGVASFGIATLGVGFPGSFPVSSGDLPAANVAYYGGVSTLVVGFPTSCPIPFQGSFLPNMASCGGVGFPTSCPLACLGQLRKKLSCGGVTTIGVETFVGFPTSCPVASPGSPVVNMGSFDGVATLGVGFQCLVKYHPALTCSKNGVFWLRRDDRRGETWRRFSMLF
jgi:hypothetical protein